MEDVNLCGNQIRSLLVGLERPQQHADMVPTAAAENANLPSPSSGRHNGDAAKQAKKTSAAAGKKRADPKTQKKTKDKKVAGKEGKPTKKRKKAAQAAEMAAATNNHSTMANGFCPPSYSLSSSSLPSDAPAAAAASRAACSFPMSRVWRLVRSEDAGTRTTNDAVFLINKASELFLERFAEDTYRNALKECKRSISYSNLSTTVYNRKRYEFLSDFVPVKVTAEDALKAGALIQP